MLNRYPLWKYLLIALVLAAAATYALPNIYPEDPAVQVSHTGGEVGRDAAARIRKLLGGAGDGSGDGGESLEYKAIEHTGDGQLLIRFRRPEDQLTAADRIREALGYRYITALNLAPATPPWLSGLNATPMNLGLDLQGGVYFLLEVDSDAALRKALERYRDEIRNLLREERVRYRGVTESAGKLSLSVLFTDAAERDKALDLVQRQMPLAFSIEERDGEGRYLLDLALERNEIRTVQDFAVQQNVLTLRKRVNELGVAEPVITRQGKNRIAVQLPGVQDTAKAKEILGATATLEFRMVAEQSDPARAVASGRAPPGTQLFRERNGEPVLLKRDVMITGEYIIDAASGIDGETGQPAVHITLDGKGARIFSRITGENVKRLMAVVFIENKTETRRDAAGELQRRTRTVKEVISVARIQEQLGKRFQITGLDSTQEARKLALLLRAGALAAPIEIVEERTVGPSLGQENIDKGMRSILLGFLLVIVFMAVYYRLFGLIADLALAANMVLIVAVMSLIPGATLTLPGIVGIVLTVGMAVDANVLIFERIREELASGASVQSSIDNGYRRALSTIADANITTLIAALVLFVFGTGPIKGFSVTLSIGILCSMFTAIMGTRAVVNLVYGGRKAGSLAI
ncbi:MAG: protein translocase subunit SecD [Gammaproteobacteria bacterium]|nr:protein translocase subunit SecD [Gammaproteobacteria bacterium]